MAIEKLSFLTSVARSGIQGCSIQLYLLDQLNLSTKPDYDYEHEHEHEHDKISQFGIGIGTLFSIVFFSL
jgi:hypothetical protein